MGIKTNAPKMSEKTQRVYDSILRAVEYVRSISYGEWLGNMSDDPCLRELYEEQRNGIVHGLWDGRCLSALERRGLIRYYDDMECDDWCVVLIDG